MKLLAPETCLCAKRFDPHNSTGFSVLGNIFSSKPGPVGLGE